MLQTQKYTLTDKEKGKYVRVVVSGQGEYEGSKESEAKLVAAKEN